MKKLAILFTFTMALLGIGTAQAGLFGGPYLGAKLGANNSSATDATGVVIAPSERTTAYILQGGYLQGGYNLDMNAVVIGVGAYGDWNAYEKHVGGLAYGTRSYGFDAKLGVPVGSWLPYAKLGRGNNYATDDLSPVSQRGRNTAYGFEYKLAPNWSAVAEYKTYKFSSRDGSITIKNNTVTLGLNYYFEEPPEPVPPPEPETEPELEPEPEPELVAAMKSAPLPEPAPSSGVWKTFMEEKAVRIEGTNFAVGSARLMLESGKDLLKEVVEFMNLHPDSNLEVIGYTDNTGSEEQNKALSMARAQSVEKYLVDAGIPADRIIVRGEGSANPVSDNNTEEGRAENRRVEIRSVVREEKKVRVTE
ncbi:MAG: OmpA family protein [Gallionella sp.]|nr:OmpA family protein [Gallionella sp.]